MKVLVTGANGQLGHDVVNELRKRGHEAITTDIAGDMDYLLDQALELLDKDPDRQDGYYAFVCEKCAPAFSYYGYFSAESMLKRRAGAIYKLQQNH